MSKTIKNDKSDWEAYLNRERGYAEARKRLEDEDKTKKNKYPRERRIRCIHQDF